MVAYQDKNGQGLEGSKESMVWPHQLATPKKSVLAVTPAGTRKQMGAFDGPAVTGAQGVEPGA